jgi:hypothetical protein
VESIEILILESFPVQVHVVASGTLPDSCTAIEQVDRRREGRVFQVTVTSVRPADEACTAELVPFEEVIALDVLGLEAGEYTVIVNGVSEPFELSVDNVPPVEPAPDDVVTGEAAVESVELTVLESLPVQVRARARGSLPDGCTEIAGVEQVIQGNDIVITLFTERPSDAICTQALVPFEEVIPVDVNGLRAGDYRVIVNGVGAPLRLEADQVAPDAGS